MTAQNLSRWIALRERLGALTQSIETKKDLAADLGVSLPAIYRYLSGKSLPSVEITLHIREWVIEEEAKQPKTLGNASNIAKGHKTRSRKTSYHEPKPSPKKQ
jgi:transcriptional regulator with XRE-family HTH domain